ncbi:MAG TPA: M20/M25/M40 family metallo-hydrolase [Caldithrix abyssi]|uniref:M20/M25/M40 family metallo-hydrolase n=1 Tax=Caldithrix abyssi TaxID=187145 RepID=A0A7V4WU71_CALAY|nr:M20/M25/M40 family metallo-hydrolase [Caldithrix abyssi]
MKPDITALTAQATALLKDLIALPSFSGQEDKTAQRISVYLEEKNIPVRRKDNNVWAVNRYFDKEKPTLLLNSHHDTVKPNTKWTFDPFTPTEQEGKLIGLGSNDAGAPLVSLLAAFVYFYDAERLPFNIIMAATAEEETSGKKGLRSVLDEFGPIDLAVVGEPTGMQLAVAEKGLMVLRCKAHGKSGHAARDVGENAIYKAIQDINWFRNYRFARESSFLGPVKMTVTIINAGSQHNVIPDVCDFTVDIRMTDAYTNEQVLETIKKHIKCEIDSVSLSLKPSSIDPQHPLVEAARSLNMNTFGSPTLSDQSLIDAPSVKIGPGMSERSHTADEFVYPEEIRQGVEGYIKLLERFFTIIPHTVP